ncbi:MAG: division/cell wall cluster transcriptional repressor MraZ [Burkholderiaceae bacterium]
MAYIGNSKVTLDPKARLAVPSRYREALLAQCGGKLVVTRGIGPKTLLLFPEPVWDKIYEQLISMPATDPLRQRYLHNADYLDMDSGGRILIPNGLREKGILTNSSLAFVGNGTHFEIWDWDAHIQNEEQLDPLAMSATKDLSF